MTTLTQTPDAACPDFPGPNGQAPLGLRLTLTPGTDGQALTHTFPAEQPHLETSCLLSLGTTLTGPGFVLLRALNEQGQESARLTIQPDARTVTISATDTASTPTQLTAPLPPTPSWTAIHAAITDSPSPTLRLSVNGITIASAALAAPPTPTRSVQIGVPLKHHDTAGTLDLDQIALSQSPLHEPLPLPPITNDHAGDPARWLVIYNTDLPDSITWADHYQNARHIPHCNLLGLPLPTTASMSPAEYEALRAAVVAYLDTNRLRDRILGILTGFGVPPIMQFQPSGLPLPTANLLATDDAHFSLATNPVYTAPNTDGIPPDSIDRPTLQTLTAGNPTNPPARLSASIDTLDLAQALAITAQALSVATTELHANTPDQIYIDPYPDPLGTDPLYQTRLITYAQSTDAGALRLPLTLADPPDTGQPANRFSQLTDDAFHLTLRADAPPIDLFNPPTASRACSLALHLAPPSPITSLREPAAANWLQAPIAAGYPAAIAPLQNASPDVRTQPSTFLEALRLGTTVAEALALASPFFRSTYLLLGDPLLTVPMPRSGYDRFGPFPTNSTLDTLAPNQPTQRLHADDDPFDPSTLPEPQGQYIIRQLDTQSRSDAALTTLHATSPPTSAPAWPDSPGWPVLRLGTDVLVPLILNTPLKPDTVVTLERDPEPPSGLLPAVAFTPDQTRLILTLPVPTQPTRFRWVLTEPGHMPNHTLWSMPVSPAIPIQA
ncbi:MAG: hypothetical protein AAF750_03405 [Planctomycetota bacterium]